MHDYIVSMSRSSGESFICTCRPFTCKVKHLAISLQTERIPSLLSKDVGEVETGTCKISLNVQLIIKKSKFNKVFFEVVNRYSQMGFREERTYISYLGNNSTARLSRSTYPYQLT